MQAHSLIQNQRHLRHGLRPKEAAAAIGSAHLLREMVIAGWIQPTVKRHKLTIYDRQDVARCWARLRHGERPRIQGPKTITKKS